MDVGKFRSEKGLVVRSTFLAAVSVFKLAGPGIQSLSTLVDLVLEFDVLPSPLTPPVHLVLLLAPSLVQLEPEIPESHGDPELMSCFSSGVWILGRSIWPRLDPRMVLKLLWVSTEELLLRGNCGMKEFSAL